MLYDNRYPFHNILDYFFGGFFFNILSLHLSIGFIFILLIIRKSFVIKQTSIAVKCSILFFALNIFNNYAYVFILSVSEAFGVIASILYLYKRKLAYNEMVLFFLFFGCTAFFHLLCLSLIDDKYLQYMTFLRLAVLLKIVVLGINFSIISSWLVSLERVDSLLAIFSKVIFCVCLCYLIQIAVFVFYGIPYGSFSSAGYTPTLIPCFGSVSIERGHFGKFLTPLYPICFYLFLKKKQVLLFFTFLLVEFLNFSASSYVFLLYYLIMSLCFFGKDIGMRYILIITTSIVTLLLSSWNILLGICNKIYSLAILSTDKGGRDFSLIWDILEKNPFGYGYGGSTFRNAHGIENLSLENAIVAFFGQFSIFAFLILFFGMICLFSYCYKNRIQFLLNKSFENKFLLMQIGGMILIFSTDILWFVANIWIVFLIFSKLRSFSSVNSVRDTFWLYKK